MVNHCALGVAEPKSHRIGPLAPIDFFRHAGAETADLLENDLWDKEVTRARKLILVNIFLEVKGKYRLEGLGRSQPLCVPNGRDHPPADLIELIKTRHTFPEPVLIGDTVGINKRKMRAAGRC